MDIYQLLLTTAVSSSKVKYVLLGKCVEVLVISWQERLCLRLERGCLTGFTQQLLLLMLLDAVQTVASRINVVNRRLLHRIHVGTVCVVGFGGSNRGSATSEGIQVVQRKGIVVAGLRRGQLMVHHKGIRTVPTIV